MSKVEIVLDKAGVMELLKSDAMYSVCKQKGTEIMNRLGDGYGMHDVNYPERKGVAVNAMTRKAMADNYNNNTLLKAVK